MSRLITLYSHDELQDKLASTLKKMRNLPSDSPELKELACKASLFTCACSKILSAEVERQTQEDKTFGKMLVSYYMGYAEKSPEKICNWYSKQELTWFDKVKCAVGGLFSRK